MVKNDELITKLQEIGFNRLESEVYLTLLKQSPLSGYKIAQIIGEGSSNIYKALDILRKKGAVMVEELPTTRQFTAVPAKEYLSRVEKQIESSLKYLSSNLPENSDSAMETRVFQLDTMDQVLERAVEMIRNAKKQIIVDGFPKMLAMIKPELEKAAQKKEKDKTYIIINSYDGTEVKKCIMIKKSAGAEALKIWKDSWLNLVVDGEKYLLAVVQPDGKTIKHAVWTNSPFLSYVLYSGIASEIMFSALIDELRKKELLDVLKEALNKYSEPVMGSSELTQQLPGFIKIMKSQS